MGWSYRILVIKSVCVFAASSDAAKVAWGDATTRLGHLIAESGLELVYGAGKVGLMGSVAEGVHARGGTVIGVIPERLNIPSLTYQRCDELIITQTMAERKALMTERSQAFIILPGGFGTLEELFEVLVLKQLGYHDKPIVFLNLDGAFDSLMACFADMVDTDRVKEDQCDLFTIATTPEAVLEALSQFRAPTVSGKWTEADASP